MLLIADTFGVRPRAPRQPAAGTARTKAILQAVLALLLLALVATPLGAQESGGGEANLVIPNLDSATYLATQGKFLILLEVFIAVIIVFYFGFLLNFEAYKVVIILLFSVVGIAGSFSVAAFGMRSARSAGGSARRKSSQSA